MTENQDSVGKLLVDFLAFYLFEFDNEKQLISIKDGGFCLKGEKNYNSLFTLEDPFENDYDPGHTLRPNTPEAE